MRKAADETIAIPNLVEALQAEYQSICEEGKEMQAARERHCESARGAAAELEHLLKWAYRTGTRRSATWLRREEAIVWTAGIGWMALLGHRGMRTSRWLMHAPRPWGMGMAITFAHAAAALVVQHDRAYK